MLRPQIVITSMAFASMAFAACSTERGYDAGVSDGIEASADATQDDFGALPDDGPLEVVHAPTLGPPTAVDFGSVYTFSGALVFSHLGPMTLEDGPGQPAWLVPIVAGPEVVIATGETTVTVLPAGTENRSAVMPVYRDGRPGAALPVPVSSAPGWLGPLTLCADARWSLVQTQQLQDVVLVRWAQDGEVRTLDIFVHAEHSSNEQVESSALTCLRSSTGERLIATVTVSDGGSYTDLGGTVLPVGATYHVDASELFDAGTLDLRSTRDVANYVPVTGDMAQLVTLDIALRATTVGGVSLAPGESILRRWDFEHGGDQRIGDHVFDYTVRGVAVLEDHVIVCGFTGAHDFGGGIVSHALPAGTACVGLNSGRPVWVVQPAALASVFELSLHAGNAWLRTVYNNFPGDPALAPDDATNEVLGALIGVDPRTGVRVAHATKPWAALGEVHPMVGEGKCEGLSGIGAIAWQPDDARGRAAYELVLASPDGAACRQPLVHHRDVRFDYNPLRLTVYGRPAPGPCGERPHLALIPKGTERLVGLDAAGETIERPSGPEQHPPLMFTFQAHDCALGFASEPR